MGVGGLWRCKGWETSGSQTPTKTDNVGGKTAYAAWAGTAQRSERRTDGDAGEDGLRELLLTFEMRYEATTLMRGENRRSLWRVQRSELPTLSAPTARECCVLAARKALRRFCRGRTAAMRNAREDRPQSKNDARPGGIAARFDYGEAVPRSGNGGSELARSRDC